MLTISRKTIETRRKFLTGLFVIMLVVAGVIFAFFMMLKPFWLTQLQYLLLFTCSLLSVRFDTKYRRPSDFSLHDIKRSAKTLLILVPLVLSFILFTPTVHVVIEPKNRPTLNFWCGSPPRDNETLQFSAENEIEYTVYMDGNKLNEETRNQLARAIANEVTLHLSLGLPGGFLNLNNADKLKDVATEMRTWLREHDLYADITSFIVDAEPSETMFEGLDAESSALGKIRYFVNDTPSEEELETTTEDINGVLDMFHEDGKELGIAKMPLYYDEIDADNDINLLLRNIYMLDIDWDYSVSMIYRTHHQPSLWNLLMGDLEEFHEKTSDFEPSFYL